MLLDCEQDDDDDSRDYTHEPTPLPSPHSSCYVLHDYTNMPATDVMATSPNSISPALDTAVWPPTSELAAPVAAGGTGLAVLDSVCVCVLLGAALSVLEPVALALALLLLSL